MCKAILFEDRHSCKFGLAAAMPITTAIAAIEQADYLISIGSVQHESVRVSADHDCTVRHAHRSWKSHRKQQYRVEQGSVKAIMFGLIAVADAL